MHFCPVLLDSNLSDGVGVVLEPEGKPPTQSQTWSNPRFNLLPEMISAASHMPYCILKLLQLCVSCLRGFVWFFPLRRGEERTNVVL